MNKSDIKGGLIAVGITQLVGVIGSLWMPKESLEEWYMVLTVSPLNPPNWLFGIVWPVLYTLIGIAGYLLYKKSRTSKKNQHVFRLFLIHMGFNSIWTFCFFYLRSIVLGSIDIVLILGSLIWIIQQSRKIDMHIVYLLLPYLTWVSFATYLQMYILFMN